jgi:hypothetical protein
MTGVQGLLRLVYAVGYIHPCFVHFCSSISCPARYKHSTRSPALSRPLPSWLLLTPFPGPYTSAFQFLWCLIIYLDRLPFCRLQLSSSDAQNFVDFHHAMALLSRPSPTHCKSVSLYFCSNEITSLKVGMSTRVSLLTTCFLLRVRESAHRFLFPLTCTHTHTHSLSLSTHITLPSST